MLTNRELRNVLDKAGLEAFNETFTDEQYSLPAREWLEGGFAVATRGNLVALGLARYTKEAWDCDDFAWTVAALARMNHRINGNGTESALAFGMCGYHQDDGEAHAVCFAVTHDKLGEPEVVFIEPQTQRIIELSKTERDSLLYLMI